jgi:hypothetical protein
VSIEVVDPDDADAGPDEPRPTLGRFGIWCEQTKTWYETLLGQTMRYASIDAAEPDRLDLCRRYPGWTWRTTYIESDGSPAL